MMSSRGALCPGCLAYRPTLSSRDKTGRKLYLQGGTVL